MTSRSEPRQTASNRSWSFPFPERVALIRRVGFHCVETQVRKLGFRVDDVEIESQRLGGLLGFVELFGRLSDVDVDADHLIVAVLLFQ